MSDIAESLPEDRIKFFDGLREFFYEKKTECENLTAILNKHPKSPEPEEDVEVLSENSISEAASKMIKLIDDEAEDAPLLPKYSPRRPDSLQLTHGKKSKRAASPSTLRNRIKHFLSKEYERLCKIGSEWKKEFKAADARTRPGHSKAACHSKPPFPPSPETQVDIDTCIALILEALERIQFGLTVFSRVIDIGEAALARDQSHENWLTVKKFLEIAQENFMVEYRLYVETAIKDNQDMTDYLDGKSGLTPVERKILSRTPSAKVLREKAQSKAPPEDPSQPGPSGARPKFSGGASTSTSKPKRPKEKSPSGQEKKKKLIKGDSPGPKEFIATRKDKYAGEEFYSTSSSSSDAKSRDTTSLQFNEMVEDLDLSENWDSKDEAESKDKMEES